MTVEYNFKSYFTSLRYLFKEFLIIWGQFAQDGLTCLGC